MFGSPFVKCTILTRALLTSTTCALLCCGANVQPELSADRVADASDARDDVADADRPSSDGGTAPLRPARALSPSNTSTVTSQRPTLRWTDGSGNRAVVELSRTRDFATVRHRWVSEVEQYRAPASLEAGVWFWRLRAMDRSRDEQGRETSPVWWFRVGARSADQDRDTAWGSELDLNGDGFADVAIAAPNAERNTGRVDVFYGGPRGIGATPDLSLRGAAVGDQFGGSVASAGDVNGDGFVDLIVGAPYASREGVAAAGQAVLFFGAPGGLSPASRRVYWGSANEEAFGASVASAGDVDRDGYGDLIVGAPGAAPNGRALAGAATVIVGHPDEPRRAVVIEGAAAGDHFGGSVSSAGDSNADGFADVAIGAFGVDRGERMNVGEVRVFRGSRAGLVTSAARVILGTENVDGISSVACAGDVNGDGFADLITGASDADPGSFFGAGRASLYYGTSEGVQLEPAQTFVGSQLSQYLGVSVAGIGDVNLDGYADVAVGAYGEDFFPNRVNGGSARLYFGSARGLPSEPALRIEGVAQNEQLGRAVAGPGDINGDGIVDLVVGGPALMVDGRARTGIARVFVGSREQVSTMPRHSVAGREAQESFGQSIAR